MFLRGFALFFACITAVNPVIRPTGGGDCSIWWVDLRILPPAARLTAELLAAVAFAAIALGWLRFAWVRRTTAVVLVGLATVCAINSFTFFRLVDEGRVAPSVPIPLTLLVTAALTLVAVQVVRTRRDCRERTRRLLVRCAVAGVAGAATAAAVLPAGQMLFFGTTDYRAAVPPTPATTAVVVLGAGVHSDGTPSLALHDRVTTACRLYHEGRAATLIFSGGPGPGTVHETEAMRTIALSAGVPDWAIVLDRHGLSTEATARNAGPLLLERNLTHTIAVSHGYHLPRVKLAFAQQGITAYTTPAVQSRTLAALPYYMLREVPAMWVYWLNGAKKDPE